MLLSMRLCQLMFIGDAELAGDLFEIAGLLVSKHQFDPAGGRGDARMEARWSHVKIRCKHGGAGASDI